MELSTTEVGAACFFCWGWAVSLGVSPALALTEAGKNRLVSQWFVYWDLTLGTLPLVCGGNFVARDGASYFSS